MYIYGDMFTPKRRRAPCVIADLEAVLLLLLLLFFHSKNERIDLMLCFGVQRQMCSESGLN